MGVSGQRHAPAALYPRGKRPPVPIGQEVGWAPDPVWTEILEEKSSASVGDRTPVVLSVIRHVTLPAGNGTLENQRNDGTSVIKYLIGPELTCKMQTATLLVLLVMLITVIRFKNSYRASRSSSNALDLYSDVPGPNLGQVTNYLK
jgi:hypothetical protein